MATGSAELSVGIEKEAKITGRFKTFLRRYFYLCMALAMSALVVWSFSRTVGEGLIHANPPRPWLLWIHGAAFANWMLFFIFQSALVRTRNVSVHRFLGWFGAGLAALMVTLGSAIAVIMARFDTVVLHQPGRAAFLSIPFCDMIVFGVCIALAILWRKTPDYHRRLLFIATCHLMDAAIGRFDFWFDHSLFYAGLDGLIALGMLRDWMVDGRVHKVYAYALPPIIALQSLAVYMWRVDPGWWQGISHAILGW